MQSSQVKYISLISNSIPKTTHFPSITNLTFPKNGVIVSAWRKKRPSGSIRSTKIMLQSAYFIASKLNILPEPLLYTILREFGGGNGTGGGGGFGFGSGHGWGGFDGRRRKKINWGFGVVFLVILGVGFWKRWEIDVFLGVLGLTLFGFSVNVWKRGFFDWALGFCCCAALLGLFLKEDLQKRVRFARRRRRKRRLF